MCVLYDCIGLHSAMQCFMEFKHVKLVDGIKHDFETLKFLLAFSLLLISPVEFLSMFCSLFMHAFNF